MASSGAMPKEMARVMQSNRLVAEPAMVPSASRATRQTGKPAGHPAHTPIRHTTAPESIRKSEPSGARRTCGRPAGQKPGEHGGRHK